MGIHGLLPFLKPFVKKVSIEEFRGKSLGVDAMCWMHKGAFACSQELVLGIDTDRFIYFFLRMCEVLRASDIKPIIVFDGQRLPAKAAEEAQRNDRRERNRAEALELFKRRDEGQAVDERVLAAKCEGAIKITSEMISRLMTALNELQIHFCVAPFEADAQLAYLCRIGWVQAVISEDSDLLAYGCPNTIFKMDKFGNGENIVLPCLQTDAVPPAPPAAAPAEPGVVEDADGDADTPPDDAPEAAEDADAQVPRAAARGRGRGGRGRGGRAGAAKKKAAGEEKADDGEALVANLKHWTAEKFTELCIFCGTDYNGLPGLDVKIKGLGVKTAFNYLRKFQSSEKMLAWMRGEGRWNEKFPCSLEDYMQRFFKILAVFFHHIVFDPRIGAMLSIARSFPHADRAMPNVDLAPLCGEGLAKDTAKGVWKGILSARTLQPRNQEALTPAERRRFDELMSQKRQEQRQHLHQQRFEQTLRADAQEAAARREAAAAAQAQDNAHDKALEALLTEEVSDEPKEMCLRPGDSKAIFAVLEEEERTRQVEGSIPVMPAPAPSASSQPFRRAEAPSTTAAPSLNPFARKRLSCSTPTEGEGELQSQTDDCQRPAKALRSLGSRSSNRPATESVLQSLIRPVATPAMKPEPRQLAIPLLGPRGGRAADDAAAIVLAQRGMADLAPLPANKDKSKLTGFFSLHRQQPVAQAGPPKESALATWRSRPWEQPEEEEDSTAIYENPLSLKGSRSVAANFLTRGW